MFEVFSTTTRTDIDRGYFENAALQYNPTQLVERSIDFRHYKKFKEPPVTSRYKPLIHTIETPSGTPENINGDPVTVDVRYSYGNVLQGFANRDLNQEIQGSRNYSLGKIKRPYEVFLDYRRDGVDESISGLGDIKSFVYEETIFPKEVYTYLSGTRARLSFTNRTFWRDDQVTGSQDISAVVADMGGATEGVGTAFNNIIMERNNRQFPRMKDNFTTSQGTLLIKTMQVPNSKKCSGLRGDERRQYIRFRFSMATRLFHVLRLHAYRFNWWRY